MTEIEERLQQKDIRPTSNRILVLRALMGADGPMSLGDIDQQLMTLDKSSIFRVLTLFLQHSLVHAIEDGSGAVKYELCKGHHHCSVDDMHVHFHCELCNRTVCMEDVPVPLVAVPPGFTTHSINYIIKGVCADCSSRQ